MGCETLTSAMCCEDTCRFSLTRRLRGRERRASRAPAPAPLGRGVPTRLRRGGEAFLLLWCGGGQAPFDQLGPPSPLHLQRRKSHHFLSQFLSPLEEISRPELQSFRQALPRAKTCVSSPGQQWLALVVHAIWGAALRDLPKTREQGRPSGLL